MKAVWKQRWVNMGLVIASIAVTLGLCEFGARVLLRWRSPLLQEQIALHQTALQRIDSMAARFQPHPYLIFQPSDVQLTADGCEIAGQFYTFQKPDNTVRVACLGGSTTMRAYPEYLQAALQGLFPQKRMEVMDWGCSNWTTVESALNYTLRGRLFTPDVVIIHHGVNDNPAEVRKTYRADYSHYRTVFTLPTVSLFDRLLSRSVLHSWLRLRTGDGRMDLKSRATQPVRNEDVYMDTLPPEPNFRAYREALRSITTLAHADGATVIVAGMAYRMGEPECPLIERNNRESARVAQEQKALFIDMQRQFALRQDFFKDVVHVHSGGNEIKGNMLASAVAEAIGERPSVWMSTPADRHDGIIIQWRDFGKEHDMIDLYLRVADGDLQFLTRLPKNSTSFVWKKNQPGLAPAFRDGPQQGVEYECCVYTLLEGKIQSPLFMAR